MPVQINGKVRARVTVPADAAEDELRELALADRSCRRTRTGKTIQQGGGRQGTARQRGGGMTDETCA